jgi:tRNA(adenine34) deaminase
MTDEDLMRAALTVAAEGLESGELPIGAVAALDGSIIARAHTAERASGRLLVHADLLALQAVDQLRLSAQERRRTVFAVNLEPCLMCLGAVMSALIGTSLHALDSPSDGAVGLVRGWRRQEEDFPAYRVPRMRGGILAAESRALFGKYVARYPDRGGFTAWARTLA